MAGWNCPHYEFNKVKFKFVDPVYNCGTCVSWRGTCILRVGWTNKIITKGG